MTNVRDLEVHDHEFLTRFLDEIEEAALKISDFSQAETNENKLEELLLQAEKLVKDIVSVEDLLFGYGEGLIEGAMGMARVIQQSIDNCRCHRLRGRLCYQYLKNIYRYC